MTSISSEKRYLRRKKINKCKYENGDSGRERNTDRHGARYHDMGTQREGERGRAKAHNLIIFLIKSCT